MTASPAFAQGVEDLPQSQSQPCLFRVQPLGRLTVIDGLAQEGYDVLLDPIAKGLLGLIL